MHRRPERSGFAQAGDVFARPARPPRVRIPQAPNEAGAAFAGRRAPRPAVPIERPREAGSVFARRLCKPAPPVFKASTD